MTLKSKMTFEIKIGSGSFNNIKKFHSNDEKFTIYINNNAVSLPLNVAVSISSSITDILLVDSEIREFNVVIDFNNPENVKRIISIISSQNNLSICSISNKKDALDFAQFGKIIGNEEFINPLLSIIKGDTSPINCSNVIERIEEKTFLSQIDNKCSNISNEISFIQSHFSEVCKDPSFIKWCLCESNINIVEEIVCSKELRLESEDELLSFIIEINGNLEYTHLLQYVHLEFCSITKCREFINYINNDEFFVSSNFRNSILNCISNRILYNYYSYNEIKKYESRFSKNFVDEIVENSSEHLKEEISKLKDEKSKLEKEFANNTTQIKILRSEHKNGNVILEASSISSGRDVYNLINDDIRKCFFSKNVANSYFQASLKNNKTFILNKYSIKGQKGYCNTKSWTLQGQKASNGEWISLDHKTNVDNNSGKEYIFDISCSERLKAVKFTMEETNGYNNCLILNSFDIIGELFD